MRYVNVIAAAAHNHTRVPILLRWHLSAVVNWFAADWRGWRMLFFLHDDELHCGWVQLECEDMQ
jgi:hypothetical protein